jgi:hypothetical protein
LPRKLWNSLRPHRRKKKSTSEYAEIAELFLGTGKKHKFFQRYGALFALRSSGDRENGLNEEEAESAEQRNWNVGRME